MNIKNSLHLFEAFGIEIEYMIVDRDTLAVKPVADELIRQVAGEITNEVAVNGLAWSNELVLHLVELKTARPLRTLDGNWRLFQRDIQYINELLRRMNAQLMPGGMHPFMNPSSETVLWPHGHRLIYETYHRIFNCRNHGWANLQSMHVNLPFADDDEFARLHAAVRLALPVIPVIAASSPVMEGCVTGYSDTRLEVYRNNQTKVPFITGSVIPEPVFTREQYHSDILDKIYSDISPYDPEGILRDEWLNSRGAIARFERDTIEIRLLDSQEYPTGDLAIASAVVALVRFLVEEFTLSREEQMNFGTAGLYSILKDVIRYGGDARISDAGYLHALGYEGDSCTGYELWSSLLDFLYPLYPDLRSYQRSLDLIIAKGSLSKRILDAIGSDGSRDNITSVYRRLSACLQDGVPFLP